MTDANNPPIDLPPLVTWLVKGQVRHLLTTAGGALLSAGFIPNVGQENQFIAWGVSGVLMIAGFGWSYASHKAAVAPST